MKNKLFSLLGIFLLYLFASSEAIAENGCRTGASALGNAFIRANPVHAYYYGSLESYVANNREHFIADADSIRCAKTLSQALVAGAINSYDPNDLRRKQELDVQLQTLGIVPGPAQPTASQQLYVIALQLDRLARVLPAAAIGNYQPLRTPINEIEQMQMFAAQILVMLMQQDPMVNETFRQMEPIIREGAELEYNILVKMAESLDSK